MSLFQRTIKLLVATVGAIALSDFLGLSYASSAGIIAILSVLDTRKSSLTIAWQRLLSALLALTISCLFYWFFGFHLLSFALYLIFFVPLSYRFQLQVGIAPITVLVLHLLAEKTLSLSIVGNELALFFIGAGLALFVNIYMPSRQAEVDRYHQLVEEQLKLILLKFQDFLERGNGENEAQLILELEEILKNAISLVYLEQGNQLFQSTNYQIHYFEMRQNQNRILKRMARSVRSLSVSSEEAQILAVLFSETASQLSQQNPALGLLEHIEQTLDLYRKRPLPKTREEFEYRALLFELLGDLEDFIQLKVTFYQSYQDGVAKT
ncbi:aromatic acid exporter family protein [Streptococcus saliviloxodontae]|uniref:Uncharacterized membrane protein YgaE (UPF0421/DUF939 family) n=1 Tax=Streptococcus saliviloxodontae TaxID=1349416 RepID=A0ABS2PM56_9STRE|nr:aromatic acid exporter family protein [Streptococcus saliviloxodontae]MBM7636513.1 uncharacterized membrane protein YgaE (UPF0421/DUF939 family) [Streptococcus saliviloxodontae]